MAKRTWDEKKARELLDSGMEVEKVAKTLGTATVNLKGWMKKNYAAKECPAAPPADVSHIVGDDTTAHKEEVAPVPVSVAEERVQEAIVEPREVWEARRLEALVSGLRYHLEQKKTLPAEWVEEFNQMVRAD